MKKTFNNMKQHHKQLVLNRQKKEWIVMRAFAMVLFMALFTPFVQAQTTINMTNGTSEVTSAGVNFYDSGGPGEGGSSRYRHNEEYTYSFTLPTMQSESGLKVEFSMLRVNDDHLYIYEGTAMNDANLIADFTCNDWYYSFTDLCASGNITVYSHGAITFKFVSNERYRDNGWAASITIIDPDDINDNPPAPVIAMRACENVVELLPTMISTEAEGSLGLYYNIGGSDILYNAPFSVSNGTTITAYAKLGDNQSAANHSVTVNRAPINAPTLQRVNENNDNLLKVTRPTVPTGVNDTYKVRYTLDGSDPTTSSTAITINWIHVTGTQDHNDTIIDISGATWLGNTDQFKVRAVTQGTTCPDLMSAEETYKTDKLFTVTPVITLTGTTSTGTINITCATANSTIYYTVDGSTPTPNASGTYVWGASGAPTTIAAGGTVRAYAVAANHLDSHLASETYVPGGENGGSGVYGDIVLLDDREDHTWTYYSDSESPIHSLKPADVKITYTGYGEKTMTSTNTQNMPTPYNGANSVFNADVAANQVAVNVDEPGNQFIYLKTLENANEDGSGNYPYTMIHNPFQVRPVKSDPTRTIYFSYGRSDSSEAGTLDITYTDENGQRVHRPTVTINGSGSFNIPAKTGTTIEYSLVETSSQNGRRYIYFQAGYSANTTNNFISRKYSYNTTPPTTGTSDAITVANPDYRGFYAWRVKSLGGGLTISGKAVGDIIYPDETIEFVTSNAEGNEVEFEALWAKAWVNETSSSNRATNSGNYQNAYERNFKVGTSITTYDYPVTLSCLNPDGSGTVSNVTRNSDYSCSNDVKFENMNLRMTDYYINAAGHNLTIGRGVKYNANNSTNVASHIYGYYYTNYYNEGNVSLNNFTIRIESGRFPDAYLFTAQYNYWRTTSSNTWKMLWGSDYDRAKKSNTNLVVSGAVEVAKYFNATSASASIKAVVMSGTFGANSDNTEFYMGYEANTDSYNAQAPRNLEVLGGIFQGGIAGGIERGVTASTMTLNMRIKGGTFNQYIYGAGQFSAASGSRKTVITGGTFNGWVAGGCYGTDSNDQAGETDGDCYIYFGGDANMTNTEGVFGGGYGRGDAGDNKYTTNKSFVVAADEAQISGSVYGGGNKGYCKSNSEVYVKGTTLKISGSVYGGANLSRTEGNVLVTVKGGTIAGSVYGGAWGNSAQSDIVYVTGSATVNVAGGTMSNVYGGGMGSRTVIRGGTNGGTNVTISGGTINNNVYGGGEQGVVGRSNTAANAVVTVSGGEVKGSVYGAGKGTASNNVPFTSANIYGTTTVTLEKEARVKGSVYGGGENGSVGYYNNSSTATGSTVNINGGIVDGDVFGGGSYGVTNGNVVVNITWANDEYTKTEVKGCVYGGAYGKRNKVYVNGTRTVNMNNGLVHQSIYGGSRNADDALTWSPSASGQTTTCNVVNISGGEVVYQVFAAGFFGHTYGSAYAFIGQNAINQAPEHATTTGFNYAINSLRIHGNMWAGADFGNFDGTNFGDPTVEGNSYVYIDGTNYNTITDNPQNSSYMNIEGSVYGCGTSCDAGKTDTKVVIRNYGQPVASSSKNIDEPYQTATRSLNSIQRANTVVLDNAHITFVGQGKVNSLVTTEKYAIHNVSTGLFVVNGSSVMINYPIDEIKKLVNGTCANVYAATPSFVPVNLPSEGSITVENKYRVYNGTYINVFYTTETTTNGTATTEEKFGELSGFAYMMTDAYQGDDDTKSCAYARPKWGQGASFNPNDPNYDNTNDGGFISYTATYNQFDVSGANAAHGVQMRYENHVYTSKAGEDYFRIWRYGGLFSYREAVLIAKSSGEAGTYNICDATVELPATEQGGYYRIQIFEGGTSIDYGSDASTCNVGFYGDTYSTETSNWMTYTGNNFVPGQAMSATNVQNGLHVIDGYPNVNFGLVAIPSGAMTPTSTVTNGNWLICESSDEKLAHADTKWTYSDESKMPEVLFRLTYSNEINLNNSLDPINIFFEQYKPKYDEQNQQIGFELADVVQVALIITTKTSIEQDVKTHVVAIMNGTGETSDVYKGRVTLPSYNVNISNNEDPSTWKLKSVEWSDVVEDEHTGAQLVANSQTNYAGSDSKFAMMFYASSNKDNSIGWDDWQYGPFDAQTVQNGVTIGKTWARKDFTINFDLYYDGEQNSSTQQLGTITFVFEFDHYGNGNSTEEIKIAIDVHRKGTGTNYYLDGVNGDNSYAGTRPDAAKKTLAAILSRTDYMAGDNIFLVNTVTQNEAATLSWDGFSHDHITIYRYPGGHPLAKDETNPELFPLYYHDYPAANPCFKGVMVDVKTKMEMHYVNIDGFAEEIEKVKSNNSYVPIGGAIDPSFVTAFETTAPMFEVENGGQLTMANNTLLTNNVNTSTTHHGGAVMIDEGGTLNMTINSKIQGNAAAGKGGGVYMNGTMNISGLVHVTGNIKFVSSKANAQASNIYLNKYGSGVVTLAGEVDENSLLGITKDEWNGKWYTPVVYSDVASRLDVFYDDYDLERLTDDKKMYELNALPTLTDFNNPAKHLFFVGTWVTAVTAAPDGFAADNINTAQKLAWAISVATGYNQVNNGDGYPNTNFKLTADIDMNDNIWVPIGNSTVKYTGTFDGNGHVVTGIRSPLDNTEKGMFGVINGATITNLIAQTNFPEGNSKNLAALVGIMENGTISNCEVAGTLVGNNHTENMGGLVAKANAGTIHSVFAVNTLTGGDATVMGGLVGTNGANLFNSYSNVTLSGNTTTKGGLVGVNNANCHVENCYVIVGENTFPAFAATNNGNITYCYSDKDNYIGTGTTPVKSGTYDAVKGIKELGYLYGDNLVTAPVANTYANHETLTYLNYHTPVWNGLLSVLNQWVADENIEGKPSGVSTWNRPITNTINGDLPILAFPKDNCLGNLAEEDGKMLRYSAFDANNNGLDNLLGTVYHDKTANIYLYQSASNVANGTGSNQLFIHEDAALTQSSTEKINATVGVTFDNSCKSATAWNTLTNNTETLNYDWHFLSSPLKQASLGIDYTDQEEHYWWLNQNTDNGQANNVSGSYFPNMTLTNNAWPTRWDIYTFYEPEYHWINLKRNSASHFHFDEPHAKIGYENDTYFQPGKGYMMAIETDSYLSNTGELTNENFSVNVTADSHTPGDDEIGCNLLGNPYHAYFDLDLFLSTNSLSTAWVYIAESNKYVPYFKEASSNHVLPSGYLHPHQGFFVKVTNEGPIQFTKTMATTNEDNSYYRGQEHVNYPLVNLFAYNEEGQRDFVVVECHRPETGGATKMTAKANQPFTLTAQSGNDEYSILFTDDNTKRVPIRFRTQVDGDYTMKWETLHGTFGKLLLVDNITGVTTDMTTHDQYTFTGRADDYANRFYLVFTVTGVEEHNADGEAGFAFFNGSEWVVTGEGLLQLVDVTGRVLQSQHLSGETNHIDFGKVAAGVYLLRLGEQTQKILIR